MACSQVLPRTQYWKLECCLWGTECSCQHCSRGQRGRWTYGSHILFVLFHHPPLCDCHHCLLGMCLCNGSCPPVDWVAQISLPQWTARTESHHCLPSWDIDVHWNMSALTITANSVNMHIYYWKLECCLWGTECSCQRGNGTQVRPILSSSHHSPHCCLRNVSVLLWWFLSSSWLSSEDCDCPSKWPGEWVIIIIIIIDTIIVFRPIIKLRKTLRISYCPARVQHTIYCTGAT